MDTSANGNPTSVAAVLADGQARLEQLLQDDAFWEAQHRRIAEHEALEARKRQAYHAQLHQRRWQAIPATYREEFIPAKCHTSKDVVAAVRRWTPDSGQGLGLVGTSGLGKTRLLVRGILHRLTCTWLFLPATQLSLAVRQQYSSEWDIAKDAHDRLIAARHVRVLMLDDLGHEHVTDAVAEQLMDLIEHRTGRGLPILWTTNYQGEDLACRYQKAGNAISRRLREHSHIPGLDHLDPSQAAPTTITHQPAPSYTTPHHPWTPTVLPAGPHPHPHPRSPGPTAPLFPLLEAI